MGKAALVLLVHSFGASEDKPQKRSIIRDHPFASDNHSGWLADTGGNTGCTSAPQKQQTLKINKNVLSALQFD